MTQPNQNTPEAFTLFVSSAGIWHIPHVGNTPDIAAARAYAVILPPQGLMPAAANDDRFH